MFLKKGVNLRIEKDVVLKGSLNPGDYPIIDTRFEGTERPFMSAFLNASNLDGITVSGEGTIDGSGDQWGTVDHRGGRAAAPATAGSLRRPPPCLRSPHPHQPRPHAARANRLHRPAHRPHPHAQQSPRPANRQRRLQPPALVLFTNCTNPAIEDLHLQNQAVVFIHRTDLRQNLQSPHCT